VTPPDQTPGDPGEGRLVAYLTELREDPPPTDEALVRRVHRSTRWQHAVRGPLQVIGQLGGALADGLTALLGGTRGRTR
jgi:hypothetical protein